VPGISRVGQLKLRSLVSINRGIHKVSSPKALKPAYQLISTEWWKPFWQSLGNLESGLAITKEFRIIGVQDI
jgi:hypothetical protein